MLKTKKTPRDRAFFPTEFPRVSRVPEGISPEAFHLNREFLSVVMLRYMTSRLRAVYQAYEGDMVLCLVLGEIATRNTDLIRPERNDYNRPNAPQRQYLPCNALSIEKVTGIPRETVRRKIAKLLDLGWIEKTPDDMYIISDKSKEVFAAFDDAQLFDFVNTGHQIAKIIKEKG